MSNQPSQDHLDLVYGLDDRPKPFVAFLAAFQHLLAIIVPIVTPGLLICLALGVSRTETNMILSMSLVISGIATFLQCKKVGPFGAGLLIVQGTSFNFIGPIIGIGSAMVAAGTPVNQVMAAIFGVVIAGSFIEMGVSQILPWVKRLITPLVTGIVVLLIGLTLIKEGLISMGGGYQAMQDHTFASSDNLVMSCTVLAIIIVLNRIRIVWIKSSAILIALVIGYILAGFMGYLDFSGLKDAPVIQIPTPMHFGLSFSWGLFIPMAFIYLVTSLEAIGDVTATSKLSNQPVDGPQWMQRIKGGVLVNGANSLLAGLFNTFPSSVFAQNNGVIQLTGVASRYVGICIAALLIILGLFPAVAGVIQAVPQAVLGGAVMVMFGAVAASGINILSSIHLDRRALLIIAISLALGLGVAQVPQILEHLPELFKNIFSSGVATGGIAALILNIVLPETHK
ncbi:uracil-xanthine permease family protein [Acinetobacter nosocomialis]|uniref:uracil-xanthine permease family protein n=1 Tax=Acinetobacter nosocomialis TaxID=106654 RepID=UPI0023608824|nr:uracil-xanthine permease family protein [Acinetobacter nosocomialis]MDC9815830.1 uracil-xanthine permease family protein [Acinetobacter nosocomialis]MDE9405052.1 uracil-xanthine permease family protein [Acinetobacter nosocomialis]HDG9761464.1 uracil-xanthine permease [Acinetobacter nosocomialis]